MAGIITKHLGYMYQGELTNGLAGAVENGVMLVRGTGANATKLVAPTADTASKFVCVEKTELYGVEAYRFVAENLAATYYFVENQIDINDADEYDYATYATASGELLRAHPVIAGEEFTTTMVDGAIVVGTAYGVKATGKIG